MAGWRDLIRDVPDFPRAGVVFKDITPLLADADGFAAAVDAMAMPWRGIALDAVFAIESRGFILGAALARALGLGFVPVRKAGKLPARAHAQAYNLEYGSDCLEVHADAVPTVQPQRRTAPEGAARGPSAVTACLAARPRSWSAGHRGSGTPSRRCR